MRAFPPPPQGTPAPRSRGARRNASEANPSAGRCETRGVTHRFTYCRRISVVFASVTRLAGLVTAVMPDSPRNCVAITPRDHGRGGAVIPPRDPARRPRHGALLPYLARQ